MIILFILKIELINNEFAFNLRERMLNNIIIHAQIFNFVGSHHLKFARIWQLIFVSFSSFNAAMS